MENLKKLRLERNLSQQKLADKFGMTQQSIFNYENDITEPDIYLLKQFASFFHTSVDYIIGYTDNPVTHEDTLLFDNNSAISKELHHLSLYRKLSSGLQDHLDAFLEEMLYQNVAESRFDNRASEN